jgi:hypothetical protein
MKRYFQNFIFQTLCITFFLFSNVTFVNPQGMPMAGQNQTVAPAPTPTPTPTPPAVITPPAPAPLPAPVPTPPPPAVITPPAPTPITPEVTPLPAPAPVTSTTSVTSPDRTAIEKELNDLDTVLKKISDSKKNLLSLRVELAQKLAEAKNELMIVDQKSLKVLAHPTQEGAAGILKEAQESLDKVKKTQEYVQSEGSKKIESTIGELQKLIAEAQGKVEVAKAKGTTLQVKQESQALLKSQEEAKKAEVIAEKKKIEEKKKQETTMGKVTRFIARTIKKVKSWFVGEDVSEEKKKSPEVIPSVTSLPPGPISDTIKELRESITSLSQKLAVEQNILEQKLKQADSSLDTLIASSSYAKTKLTPPRKKLSLQKEAAWKEYSVYVFKRALDGAEATVKYIGNFLKRFAQDVKKKIKEEDIREAKEKKALAQDVKKPAAPLMSTTKQSEVGTPTLPTTSTAQQQATPTTTTQPAPTPTSTPAPEVTPAMGQAPTGAPTPTMGAPAPELTPAMGTPTPAPAPVPAMGTPAPTPTPAPAPTGGMPMA